MPSDSRIRAAMAQIAEALKRPDSTEQTLLTLTRGAASAVPGVDHASISIGWRDGRLETVAATDELIERLDARQYELREGPCYAAATSDTLQVSYDLARDPRWPNYGPCAAELGVNAQMAVLLIENGTGRSAMNLYAAGAHEFTRESVEMAELFASHAALALDAVEIVGSLSRAVATRQVIGEAVGVIMERYQIDSQRAFAFLTRTSQQSNVKLRDVAAQIVDGHDGRTRPTHD
jgi:hypothetical protein